MIKKEIEEVRKAATNNITNQPIDIQARNQEDKAEVSKMVRTLYGDVLRDLTL